jgi:hypothetical protein
MSNNTQKDNNKENEQNNTESTSNTDFNRQEIDPPGNAQSKVAARLAAAISPVIAKEIISGRISFAALTVIVDNKYSGTFPFQQFASEEASDEQKYEIKINNAKTNMLAAIEFARTAGVFKNKSLKIFEEGFFDTTT